MKLHLRREAKADVRAAAQWYEKQRTGLGREFVAEIDRTLDRVAENPFMPGFLHREARRAIVHRFPYGVFYRVEGDRIIVFCVIHLHRDPATWKKRMPE